MIIRLGYVAISKTLEDITSSHTISYTNYLKINNKDDRLKEIIKLNLESLNTIMDYNIKNNIHFYRMTSNLIPLSTIVNYDYINPYNYLYKELANKINSNDIRIDMHPDQFVVLNSTRKEVISSSIRILIYHYKLLRAFNIKEKYLILHIGGNTFGKSKSISRFINTYNKLPSYLKRIIALENDDKIFTVNDTLELCKKINVPMVLDYHHYVCNHDSDEIINYNEIFSTWKNINPKVHFSSPKSKIKKDIRCHHDYINSDDFISFINKIKTLNYNIDIMIEAKAKDEAMFKLIRELKFKTDYKFIDDTSFEV